MASASNLHLSFEANDTGATILRVKQQQPPWRVVRGFRAASGETLAHVHNLSGGILDTDSLSWQVEVGPRAQAQVTSTGATRVYRSRSLDSRASQRASVHIAADAYLEYLARSVDPVRRFALRANCARGDRTRRLTHLVGSRGARP